MTQVAGAATAAPESRQDRPAVRSLLFLFSDTGGGHRASAAAVAEAIAARHGHEFTAVMFDPLAGAAPSALTSLAGLYSPLIRRAPWLWGALWHATDNSVAVRAMAASMLRLLEPALRAELAHVDPAAVVSFHPLLNHPAAHVLRAEGAPPRPLITVVTDLVDLHASWACTHADAIVTASAVALAACRRAGIPAERCHQLGLPVAEVFCSGGGGASPPQRAELRAHLGLEGQRFMVLLTGGASGSGGLRRRVRALLRSGLPLQLVVICGRNHRLRRQLDALRPPPPARLRVEGFVTNMAEWMRAADVVVTKAGPGTIAEAQCAGTPLLLTSYVPGQERGNVGFVVGEGTGRYVPRVADMVDSVAELARPDSASLAAMRAAAARSAHPEAAERIAGLVCAVARRRAPVRPRR